MNRPRIMLVEDEALVAMMMEDFLADWGWEVVGAYGEVKTALAGLEAEEGAIDAALLDINLGGEMVFPVADALKARGTPFIFLTGYTAPVQAEHYGASVLNKPFDGPQLEIALAQLLTQPDRLQA